MRLIFLASLFTIAWAAEAPVQPIPYSHKQHLALGLKCNDCHTNPDPGELMGIPASSKCMTCHSTIKKDSPEIQKLAASARDKKPIHWVRVYQIPSYVFFSHRAHLEAGAKCETCHGKVSERERLFRETDISMGGCMSCHREHKASFDCSYCHELQK
ncbi:MAG TPA: cytochrome c3 family protein [Bryobacteraceae bacterium]|nr:cytochrome c3 family protein [Bryobacteraceae bacterium]